MTAALLRVQRRVHPARDALTWEPGERWVRGYLGDLAVVDSRAPVLVWEPGFPVPLYAFPEGDVRTDLLRPAASPPAAPHPGADVFYDLVVEGDVLPHAAWRYAGDDLGGHIAFEWFRRTGRGLDRWSEEDEEIVVHPRDPYKRVDAVASSRHVVVRIGDEVVADSRRPVLVFETGLPIRYYLPAADVRLDRFTPSELRTGCPYKGVARYWSYAGPPGLVRPDVLWSYPDPIPAVAPIVDLLAFYNEAVDIEVDGVALTRPTTVFSAERP